MPVASTPATAMRLGLGSKDITGPGPVHGTIEQIGIGRAGLIDDLDIEAGGLPAEMKDNAFARKPLHRRHQPVATAMHFENSQPKGIDIGERVGHGTAGNAKNSSERLAGMKFSILQKPENFKRMRSQSSQDLLVKVASTIPQARQAKA